MKDKFGIEHSHRQFFGSHFGNCRGAELEAAWDLYDKIARIAGHPGHRAAWEAYCEALDASEEMQAALRRAREKGQERGEDSLAAHAP